MHFVPHGVSYLKHFRKDPPLDPGDVDAGRNPAPVEVGSLSHYLQGFSTIPSGCLGYLNHQQCGCWMEIFSEST